MRFRFPILGLVVAIFSGTRAYAAGEGAFDIRLERPFHAGQTFTVSTTDSARSSQKIETPDGQSSGSSHFRRMVFTGDVHVEKVDSRHLPVELSITLKRLTMQTVAGGRDQTQEQPQEILPAGTVILADLSEEKAVFMEKATHAPLPDNAVAVLRREFQTNPMTDDVFGTTEKKKLGDRWPVDTRAMKVDATNAQAVDPQALAGDMSLKEVRSVLGENCLQVEAVLRATTVPGLAVEPKEATIVATYTASLPVNMSKQPIAKTMKTATHLVVEQKALGQGVVRTTSDSEVSHEATWVEK